MLNVAADSLQELEHRVRADEKYPGLLHVKQEPLDEQGDQTLEALENASKRHLDVAHDPKLKQSSDSAFPHASAPLRESQSLVTA